MYFRTQTIKFHNRRKSRLMLRFIARTNSEDDASHFDMDPQNPHSGNRDNFLLTLTATIFKWTRIIIISRSTITRLALRSPRLLTLSSLHIKSIVCECRMSKWNINIDSCYALDSRTADHQSHGINVDDATRLSSSS